MHRAGERPDDALKVDAERGLVRRQLPGLGVQSPDLTLGPGFGLLAGLRVGLPGSLDPLPGFERGEDQ